jgi:ABC-type uncharacterized transport system substrate-binding protein
MVDRLTFIAILCGSLLVGLPLVMAQPTGKVWRIGFVGGSRIPKTYSDAFLQGLSESGFVVGQNVAIEYRWLGNPLSPMPEIVADFVRRPVDVIVAAGSPAALSAKDATKSIPIVMVGARDPVEQGLITSLARPGGNITGISSSVVGPAIASKRLALIKEALPQASRVGHLWSSTFPGTKPYMEEMLRAGVRMKLTVRSFDVNRPDDLQGAFAAMKRESIEVVSVEAALTAYRRRIVDIAAASRLPALYGISSFVEEGGLMSYSVDWLEIFRKAGGYAGRILKGANPSELPVEQPTRFELVINLRTAKAIGFTIPPSLLLQADRLIE